MEKIEAVPYEAVFASACGVDINYPSVKFDAYPADEVADLAKRCIPVTRSSIEALEGLGFGAILEKQLLIDLEQIVEESA